MLSDDEWSQLLRLVRGLVDDGASVGLATVTGYDEVTHTVRCVLQPGGHKTGALPVLAPWPGLAHPLRPGHTGAVVRIQGQPTYFLGTANSDSDPPPTAAASFEGDVFCSGVLTAAGAMALIPGESLPAASAQVAGQLLIIRPSDNSAPGKLYVCLQSAGGAYSWVQVATAP